MTTPNPVLQKLGLSNNDKVVVFHADDIGMLQATLPAYRDLLHRGSISSASVMVPCPWFPALADLVRNGSDPEPDMGVHLMLTSEWDAMRFGPISQIGRDPSKGLMDDEGYFHRRPDPVQENGDLAAITAEIDAQVDRALVAGIDVTHIDNHMGTLLHPRMLETYVIAGFRHRLATFVIRLDEAKLLDRGFPKEMIPDLIQKSNLVEAQGMPLFDNFAMLPLREKTSFKDRLEHAKTILEEAPAGLYYFIIHPSVDSPELRGTAPDWEARTMDYQLFMSETWQKAVEASGVHVVGMRQLRGLLNPA